MAYSKVRIVMVETTHPGNIGAAARAMKNMFLSRLYLVRPKVFPSAEATARASGADDLLAEATVCDSLDEALVGCRRVYGASARLRSLPWPLVDARQCGQEVAAEVEQGEVALVFGREHSGLTNTELERCNYLVHIPTNPDFSSLNVAAAVQLLAYETHMALAGGTAAPSVEAADEAAAAQDLERFYVHLEQTLVTLEFLNPDNPRQLMRRLRRLYNRANLERTELAILRGILSAAQRKAGEKSR